LKDQPLEQSTTKTKTNSKKKERTTKKDTHFVKSVTVHHRPIKKPHTPQKPPTL
jgi:hypothetical protein